MLDAPEKILDLQSLRLPASPRVAEITVVPYIDSVGDPALRVTVVVDADPDSPEYRWDKLKPIQEEIFRALREAEDSRWPYVSFVAASEMYEQP